MPHIMLCLQWVLIHFLRISVIDFLGKGLISFIYICLSNAVAIIKLVYMMNWDTDFWEQFTEQDLDVRWRNLRKCTKSLTIRNTAVKLFTSRNFTPLGIHTIYPRASLHWCPLTSNFIFLGSAKKTSFSVTSSFSLILSIGWETGHSE